MNYRMIGRILSQVLALEAVFMIPSMLLCLYDGQPEVALSYVATIGIIAAIALVLWLTCRTAERRFYAREGMVSVAGCWIVMSLLGCLPFWFSGYIPSYVDALFEIVSGFTTTGASILPSVEALPRGLLLWRSFTHWLGGMGVLVFLLVLVSGRGQNSGFTVHLLRAESPGPDVGKLVPHMRKTASVLYFMYLFLTILDILFLLAGGMPLFEALCTAFGTAGTGGFGVKNDSMAGYSPYLQNVTTIFMLLFGVNFSCYYLLLLRQFKSVFRDEELRLYFGVVLASTAVICIDLRGVYHTLEETVRHSAFQVASIITTTGFATTDFDLWPNLSRTILLCLMFVGACAGSTGGGIKCARVLLLVKSLRRNIRKTLYPQKVEAVWVNRHRVNEAVLDNANVYLAAYVLILAVSWIIISADGFSIVTNFSAVASCFNNIGPGLELVGPTSNFSGYSTLSKLVLTFDMLAGRLEILPMLAVCSGSTWRRK